MNILDEFSIMEEYQLIKKIQKSKEFIADLVLKEAVSGHRADIYLYYASKAYAAYLEEENVTEEHISTVASFVLTHRKKIIGPTSEELEKRGYASKFK